jgi:SagB-type dehydrogenase family enzyme
MCFGFICKSIYFEHFLKTKPKTMKNIYFFVIFTLFSISTYTQENGIIILNPPNVNKGLPIMKALSLRASVKEFDTTDLNIQDMSDLLWAANGINRPKTGKRTAPSAMNSQDIDVYLFMKQGVYIYNAQKHLLKLINPKDHRKLIAGRQKVVAQAPVFCLLVSDISRFKHGSDSLKLEWAAMDAGIVSQNIALFCAGTNLLTRPRASMEKDKLRTLLNLSESQYLMMNHPVSYAIKHEEN